MKILFILPYSPIPTNTGNKNLTFNLLKFLVRNANVDILIIENLGNNKKEIYQNIKNAFPHAKNIWTFDRNKNIKLYFYKLFFLIQGLSPSLGNFYRIKISDWLKVNSYKYDLIHFDMFHVSPYIKSIKNKPTLVVSSDAYSLAANLACQNTKNYLIKIWLNFYKFLLSNVENVYYKKFSKIVCVSNIDQKYLTNKLKLKKIITIGIPIAKSLKEKKIKHNKNILKNKTKTKLLITGNLNHPIISKNIASFLKNIFPKVLKKYPDLKTIILGKNPTNFLKNEIHKSLNVKHVDFVQDYFDFLDNDWIYIYPQKCATGLQTKLQQALASGLPVIAHEVSFGGLNLTYKKNAFKVENEEDFFKYIDELMTDPILRVKLGNDASKHINKNYSIQKIGRKYLETYENILEN